MRCGLWLPHVVLGRDVPKDDPRRYTIVDLDNGYAAGPLRAHLYDLGPQFGFRRVGAERPENADAA